MGIKLPHKVSSSYIIKVKICHVIVVCWGVWEANKSNSSNAEVGF
jgi:hypothetical protein